MIFYNLIPANANSKNKAQMLTFVKQNKTPLKLSVLIQYKFIS